MPERPSVHEPSGYSMQLRSIRTNTSCTPGSIAMDSAGYRVGPGQRLEPTLAERLIGCPPCSTVLGHIEHSFDERLFDRPGSSPLGGAHVTTMTTHDAIGVSSLLRGI